MKTPDLAWLDARETVSFSELAQACEMTPVELEELMELGALVPLERTENEYVFSAECVMPLRDAGKLRMDFDLDVFTVALLLGYLHRIDVLERRVKSLEAQLPRHAHHPSREGPDLWHEPRPGQGSASRS